MYRNLVVLHFLVVVKTMKVFFYLYLIMLGWQDAKTMYISKKWIVPTIVLCVLWLLQEPLEWMDSFCGSCIYGGVALWMYCKHHWLGSADVCYLFVFGFLLGYERMSIAIGLSALMGICICVCLKKEKIPYLTFLSCGIWVSYVYGYRIWFHLLQWAYK